MSPSKRPSVHHCIYEKSCCRKHQIQCAATLWLLLGNIDCAQHMIQCVQLRHRCRVELKSRAAPHKRPRALGSLSSDAPRDQTRCIHTRAPCARPLLQRTALAVRRRARLPRVRAREHAHYLVCLHPMCLPIPPYPAPPCLPLYACPRWVRRLTVRGTPRRPRRDGSVACRAAALAGATVPPPLARTDSRRAAHFVPPAAQSSVGTKRPPARATCFARGLASLEAAA